MNTHGSRTGIAVRLGLAFVLATWVGASLPSPSAVQAQVKTMSKASTAHGIPVAAPDVPGDEYWEDGFNLPGMENAVWALGFGPDGALYAGGEFTTAGGTLAGRIARWANSQWHPLGTGMNGSVYALASGPNGSLYAGGDFTSAGGVAAQRIARWDGTAWHSLTSGMSSSVNALAIGPDGSLYAGGSFLTAGGVTANRIARWDGTAWYPVGSGTALNGTVNALMFGPDGSLYVGGSFTTASGVTVNRVVRWDGTTWHPLSSGLTGGSASDLEFGLDGSLYAAGSFTSAGGVPANRIARWDGTAWYPLSSGVTGGSGLSDLAIGLDGLVYAAGDFTTAGGVAANHIARWDGAQWFALGSGIDYPYYTGPRLYALAAGPDGSIYAGGIFSTAGGVAATHIARWDSTASSWHSVGLGQGIHWEVSTLAFGLDGSLYAGGKFRGAGTTSAQRIARWDGTAWHPLGDGIGGVGTEVYSLAVGPDGSLYAGGYFSTAGGVSANCIARWDGTAWYPLGSGMSVPGCSVHALAVGADGSVYAGGSFVTAGGVTVNNIARWNGAQWNPLGGGLTGTDTTPYVFALAFGPDGSLYVGGSFTTADGVTANNIARWNGSSWQPIGSGAGAGGYETVRALAFGPDGSLYAAGYLTTIGGVTVHNIARWDGSQWHPLMNDLGELNALAFGSDGSLYVGGTILDADDRSVAIARWDGTMWKWLGSGLTGVFPFTSYSKTYALEFGPDGSLYAGGWFNVAGDKPSSNIAQWLAPCCDFDDDGTVGVDDIMAVAALWGQPAGIPYDQDGDGVITVVDIQRVARWWGAWVP